MMLLPGDIFSHISSFLCLRDYYNACVAHVDFRSERMRKKLRFRWCKARARLTRMSMGSCSHTRCSRQRLYCIELEPTKTRVLSMYCGPCTIVFKDIPGTVLLL